MGPGGSCHEFILETSLQSRVQSSWKSHWAQRTDDNKSTPGTILANTFRENKLPTETNSSSAVTDARGEWNRIFKVLKGNKCQHGILHYHSSLREKHKQLEVHKNWELVHHPQTQNARDTTTKRSVRHKNVFARRGQNDEAFLSFTCSNLQNVFVPLWGESHLSFPRSRGRSGPSPVLWRCLLLKDALSMHPSHLSLLA